MSIPPISFRIEMKNFAKYLFLLIVLSVLLLFTVRWFMDQYEYGFTQYDVDRGAALVAHDDFGDHFSKIVYLDQNWTPRDSSWFYRVTQGSNLLPYDFFLVLEQKNNEKLFRDNENINYYRYLPQKVTDDNPDGLPVGLTKDSYQGRHYLGYTCSACHTNQINFNGTGIRIDGAPSGADMETFIVDMAGAMENTLNGFGEKASSESKAKYNRFVQAVLDLENYDDEDEVQSDLKKFTQRIMNYTVINRPGNSELVTDKDGEQIAKHPKTTYGYARLDAFGRIFNRVLEHIMSTKQLRKILETKLTPEELNAVMKGAELILSGDDTDHIIERLQKYLSHEQMLALRDEIFNPPDAPVSYPFLWDIPQHDYVQWNGIVANAGVGPMGRNAGQVIGVFGTLDWKALSDWNLSTILGGQGFSGPWFDFQSSINVRNLRRVERYLRKLQSPRWPEHIFNPPKNLSTLSQKEVKKEEEKKAKKIAAFERGKNKFKKYCAACHAEIDRASEHRHVIAQMTSISSVGTDPKMAENSIKNQGYSGIFKNMYVNVGEGTLLMEEKMPVAVLLTAATRNVITTPDVDKGRIIGLFERAYEFFATFTQNEVQRSLKRGNYEPNTTANPLASLKAYKARSLNGIWATAPYLHNGSVPTLYDLLLPAEQRPKEFMVGSREFDIKKIGFKSAGYNGFKYLTSIPGNYNTGHEYAAGITRQPDGTVLPALTDDERWDLLEYLKRL